MSETLRLLSHDLLLINILMDSPTDGAPSLVLLDLFDGLVEMEASKGVFKS